MKFRSVHEAVAELKTLDPNCALSLHLIKKMAKQEKIRSLKTGAKLLVDIDSIIAFLKGEEYELPLKMLVID